MSLTKNQQKFIQKNLPKMAVDGLTKAINAPLAEVETFIAQSGLKIAEVKDNNQIITPLNKENIFIQGIKKYWRQLLFLFALVVVVYANSLPNAFVSDDIGIIVNNKNDMKVLFQYPSGSVSSVLYYLILSIFGKNPVIFRLINLLFHLGNVWLIFFIGIILLPELAAIIVSSLFAVHPITVESVAWVSGGPYVRYTFFFLLAFYLYISSKKNKKLYIPAINFFVLSLLSSDKAIVIPIIFIFYELSLGSLKKTWKTIISLFFIVGLWGLYYLSMLGQRITGLSAQSYSKPQVINPLFQIPVALTTYLQLIFWPDQLTLYHSNLSFTFFGYIVRLIITLIFLGIILVAWKKNKQIFFWLSLFIISLLPTLTPFGISWIVAERYVYLGTIGILFVVGYGLSILIKNKKTQTIGYTVLIICILGLMIRTMVRNLDWKNEDSLWLSMKDISASDPKTHNNLGDMYGRHGDLKKAEEEFKKAIALNPSYGDAYHNLGNTYVQMKKYDLALESYRKALKTNPNLWQSYQNIAAIYYEHKNFKEAAINMEKAVKVNPSDENLNLNLAIIYLQLNSPLPAREILLKILSANPQNSKVRELLFMIDNPSSITPPQKK